MEAILWSVMIQLRNHLRLLRNIDSDLELFTCSDNEFHK